jgi:signal recognition particle subunit SRP19
MVRTRADHIILWPAYFDSRKTRATGRRIPKAMAVQEPTSQELAEAVKSLGLEARIIPEKSYPSCWWEHSGCVSVQKAMKKADLISKVAPRLKRIKQNAVAKAGNAQS